MKLGHVRKEVFFFFFLIKDFSFIPHLLTACLVAVGERVKAGSEYNPQDLLHPGSCSL